MVGAMGEILPGEIEEISPRSPLRLISEIIWIRGAAPSRACLPILSVNAREGDYRLRSRVETLPASWR